MNLLFPLGYTGSVAKTRRYGGPYAEWALLSDNACSTKIASGLITQHTQFRSILQIILVKLLDCLEIHMKG